MAGPDVNAIKNWALLETMTNADLAAEFSNVYGNMSALGSDDYSENNTQMQIQTDPGSQGSESRATSVAGEIARLRFELAQMKGTTYWYDNPATTLAEVNASIGAVTYLPANRIVSGRKRADSEQPIFLVPDGANPKVTLEGSVTSFAYRIEGTLYTISSDVALTSLSVAPAANNTALVNDALLADQDLSKLQGENGTTLTIDTVGSEISNRVGQYAAFGINDGVDDEYFTAFIASATTLTKVRRGYFFDSTDAPVERLAIANNDTITLLKLTYVFAKTNGTLDVTYNPLIYSGTAPAGPSIGDKWFDLTNEKWMHYNGGAWEDSDSTLIGFCAQDDTNCIVARSLEFYAAYSELNTALLELVDADEIRVTNPNAIINVAGTIFNLGNFSSPIWIMDADLDTGAEAASTMYYAYLTRDGVKKFSITAPYDRREDLYGFYHPHHSWRCLGQVWNESGSDFEAASAFAEDSKLPKNEILFLMSAAGGHGSGGTAIRDYTLINHTIGAALIGTIDIVNGSSVVVNESGKYFIRIQDNLAAGDMALGISVNAPSLTALIQGVGADERKAYTRSTGLNAIIGETWEGHLNVGDIIRHHTNAAPTDWGLTVVTMFVTKVGN